MRDTLPINGPFNEECGIINLDSINGAGTHWVAYRKKGCTAYYYDSFGDLPPPMEFLNYMRLGPHSRQIFYYNYERHQDFNTVWCGHLCLKFLLTSQVTNTT